MGLQAKGRHFLKRKEAEALRSRLSELLGPLPLEEPLEQVSLEGKGGKALEVVLVKGEPLLWNPGEGWFLTVKGALKLLPPPSPGNPGRRVAVVDRGAVPHLCNGANVMAPGISAADTALRPGDLLVVREETHGKPLAVGRALVEGSAMVRGKGKAVENLHYVGDELWKFEP
ncbi:MAG: RNA-binding protein [Halobacteria archaeon]